MLEVDTPAFATGANPDPAIEPIAARRANVDTTYWLHTSPELAMKRLLAAGSGDIYQLCRVFRDGELGRWHEPEFMLLEWYRLGIDEHALMDEVADLLDVCLDRGGQPLPRIKFGYAEAFDRCFGIDPHRPDSRSALAAALERAGVGVPPGIDDDACLDLAMGACVIPSLPRDAIVFIHDYPASQAALAVIRDAAPPVAARFEVFVAGVELGNGYLELTDATEQRERFARDAQMRRERAQPALPIDEAFLTALDGGLPPCAGVALGVDRIAALLAGADSIGAVVNFPHGEKPA